MGSLVVDCSFMNDYLIDLPPGGKGGLCTTDDEYADAWLEIEIWQATYGALAGIPDAEIAAAAERAVHSGEEGRQAL